MYNYDLRQDYYNYNNNNYNQPLYTEDENPNSVYDPYAGFIRGNMFPDLYNSYKVNKPIEIKPSNEKMQMKTMLDAMEFATIDLNLYLDIYPNDRDMIQLFSQYVNELEKVKEEYEKKYGPLTTNCKANEKYPWAWDDNPWPWEGQ